MGLTQLHLNSCVYELQKDTEGNLHPLMKQVNNAILVDRISIRRFSSISFNDLIKTLQDTKEYDIPAVLTDNESLFWTHPMTKERMDEVMDFTVVWGIMEAATKEDPTKPIPVMGTDEEQHEARLRALLPKLSKKFFVLVVPETPEYMWDLAFSHVPSTAISHTKEEGTFDDTVPAMPLGIDPTTPYLSDNDIAILEAISKEMKRQYLEENDSVSSVTTVDVPDHQTYKIPTSEPFDLEKIAEVAGFSSVGLLKKFTDNFGLNLQITKCDWAKSVALDKQSSNTPDACDGESHE